MAIGLGRHGEIDLESPVVMGILNVTPDSFSDGGRWTDVEAAVRHGLAMAKDGARLIDVGGESTRPGADRVDGDEQMRRILPVIEQLRRALDQAGLGQVAISVDTTSADVAEAALASGAAMINDVSAGCDPRPRKPRPRKPTRKSPRKSSRATPRLFELAAKRDVPVVLMHMRGEPATMQDQPQYEDVVAEVLEFLTGRASVAIEAGVAPQQIVIDPGIGFGKTLDHNLQLLAHLDRFVATGYAVMLGASRKRFIDALAKQEAGIAVEAADRLGGTCAVTAWAVHQGVTILRVHDVLANRQALEVARAIRSGARPLQA